MTKQPNSLQHRLERHFVACSTVTGVAFVLSGQEAARAAITYIVPGGPIAIPNNFAGIYFNIENGVFDPDPTLSPGWDVNPYGGGGGLTWYAPAAAASSIAANPTVTAIAPLTDLSTLVYDPAAYNLGSDAAILAGGTFFVGFQFSDGAAATNRAWVEITTTGALGFPAQINRWAFAPIAEPLAAGQIPEPGAAALGLLAAGAVGLRRRRAA